MKKFFDKAKAFIKTAAGKIISLLIKYKEPLLYLVFGGLTTLINWGVSNALFYAFEVKNVWSNVAANAVAITFAYITNKLLVFNSHTRTKTAFLKEIASFYGVRAISAGFDIAAMWLTVDIWKFKFWICKIVINVIIVVLNYIFSKLWIFKRGQAERIEQNADNSATDNGGDNADGQTL